jgi:hypothetical protein
MRYIPPAFHDSLAEPIRNGLADHGLASPRSCNPRDNVDASAKGCVGCFLTAYQVLHCHKAWGSHGKRVIDMALPLFHSRLGRIEQHIPSAGESRNPPRNEFKGKRATVVTRPGEGELGVRISSYGSPEWQVATRHSIAQHKRIRIDGPIRINEQRPSGFAKLKLSSLVWTQPAGQLPAESLIRSLGQRNA